MSAIYDYQTGELKRDFHFIKYGKICRLAQLPNKSGSLWCRIYCNYHKGDVHPSSFPLSEISKDFIESYVMCNHPNSLDDNESYEVRHLYYEKIQQQALCAL